MKFRNKKTGEVLKIYPALNDETAIRFMAEGGKHYEYKSLAEFNKFWEDAPEEPKRYWFINTGCEEPIMRIYGEPDEMDKELGNYFETREEAERAYEKLKAWQRLKDNKVVEVMKINFRNCCIGKGKIITFEMYSEDEQTLKDLDMLFGGEE